jgi:hypothetical protein
MTLILHIKLYADPYHTNWNYLRNMTEVQMNLLKQIWWDGWATHIRDGLWFVPSRAVFRGRSANYFINELQENIMEL